VFVGVAIEKRQFFEQCLRRELSEVDPSLRGAKGGEPVRRSNLDIARAKESRDCFGQVSNLPSQ
jgi:hypothetical protein